MPSAAWNAGRASVAATCPGSITEPPSRPRAGRRLHDPEVRLVFHIPLTHFPAYELYRPRVEVRCVTPGAGRVLHRFFDTSPFSPSGRFLALTRLPFEDRMPQPGDVAEVVLVDLQTGEERTVAETRGWDTQLGAQCQWGRTDNDLLFNDQDIHTWTPYGVHMDPSTGRTQRLEGTVYMVSPDGSHALSPCLLRTGATQAGYGVLAPTSAVPINRGAPEDDGVFLIDTSTGQCRLLMSLAQIVAETQPLDPATHSSGSYYAAHVKWNPQGTRIMLVLRWLPDSGEIDRMERMVVTANSDGSDTCIAVPAERWRRGGHHPNWCPDGDTVLMNLSLAGKGLQFVAARYDGSSLEDAAPGIMGSGHPTMHPDGRHILTDAYPGEPVAFGDGTVPIRWIDRYEGEDTALVRVQVVPPFQGPKGELRVDPHPAWDRTFRYVAFNACPDGTRRVYVADLSSLFE